MKGKSAALLALAFVAASVGIRHVAAQTAGSAPAGLRQQIEQRFDVLTVQDGLALRPKTPIRDVRWVEVADGMIRIDGAPVSGAELRSRLGDTAGPVLQLSYLEPAARDALFQGAGTASPGQTPAAAETAPARTRESSGQFKLGGSITVPADERVSGDVVVIGGSIHVFGEVRGGVVAIGGIVELGPESVVKDVTVIGGSLRRDPAARVSGEVVELGAPQSGTAGARFPRNRMREILGGGGRGSGFAFFATLARIAVLCLLAALVVLLGKDYVDRVGHRAAAEPLKAGAIGLLAQLLLLPVLIVTVVLLIITIIGIPLLVLIPFVVLGLAAVALVGFTSVAHHVGRLVNARFGWEGRGPYATTLIGILLLVSPLVLARLVGLGGALFPMRLGLVVIGSIVEYLAWTIGFGAVALARFSRSNSA